MNIANNNSTIISLKQLQVCNKINTIIYFNLPKGNLAIKTIKRSVNQSGITAIHIAIKSNHLAL